MRRSASESPSRSDSFPGLRGLAGCGRVVFIPDLKGDPLRAFPELAKEGKPFNRWLTQTVLEPLLESWGEPDRPAVALSEAVANDLDRSSGQVRLAFQEVLPIAVRVGEPAILAALGVAANLERTLAVLGEFMLGERMGSAPVFRISRPWCGLMDYPLDCDYLPGQFRRPVRPERLRSHRRDPRHLRNALWCTNDEIEARCTEALESLKEEIRKAGVFTADDLRHLHAHSFPGPGSRSPQEKRSGVVRLKNSSM